VVKTPPAAVERFRAGSAARIVFLCAQLDNGGAERHWAELLPALAQRQIGVRLVALLGGRRALENLRAEGVPVRELGRDGLTSVLLLPALLAQARAQPSALVSFGYNAHALGALFARITRTPHVVNWHRQAGWPMDTVEANAVRLAGRLGAGAIAVTEAQHPDLLALDFEPQAIHTVANGVAPQDPGRRTPERARLNMSPTSSGPCSSRDCGRRSGSAISSPPSSGPATATLGSGESWSGMARWPVNCAI
jgi:Glycosyltransferase Family 4